VRGRLGFDAGALRDGLGRSDDGVRFCVGLGLRKDRVVSLVGVRLCPEGVRTLRDCALMRATERIPSSCLALLLFSRSTFCKVAQMRYVLFHPSIEHVRSVDLGLQSALSKLVHCARDFT